MKKKTTCSALEWNAMLGLAERLKSDGHLRDYLLITLGCHFGLRISDLLKLTWNDLIVGDEVAITEKKTNKERAIKMNARVREATDFCMNRMNIASTEHPVLANRKGESLSVSYVNKRLKWIFARYRIKTQNPSSHTLRKTFGMRVYQLHGESDKALVFLSEVFGHSSTAITRRYLGITRQQITELYMNL